MENHYQEFDNIMEYYQEAKKYILDNADYFANKKAEKITYRQSSSCLQVKTRSTIRRKGIRDSEYPTHPCIKSDTPAR